MKQQIHFIGIGGTGMGPLAKVYLEMGWDVSGSDLQPSETTQYLTELGAQVYFGHEASNINGAQRVVYSTAIPQDNPEVLAAKTRNLEVYHRSEMWAQLLNERRGIAVGGAHGKTTTTSMIAWVMEESGYDPVVLIGARFAPFGPGAKFGNGQYAVAEADESDRSFLRYYPEMAIVTGIEADHLENYNGAFQELIDTYQDFLRNIKPSGKAVLCIDDTEVRKIAANYQNMISYGFSDDANWRAEIIDIQANQSTFDVLHDGKLYGRFQLGVPGRHNITNALAAIAVCYWSGLTVQQIKEPLASFTGAQRRFQILGEKQNIIVVDDYAHHPTEIAATLGATKEGWKRRVIAVFQPQRYSRTKFLFDEFARVFSDADIVVLTDIYSPPPEQPINGINSEILAQRIREQGKIVHYVANREDVAPFVHKLALPNDFVITMGAGPIWKSARELFDLL